MDSFERCCQAIQKVSWVLEEEVEGLSFDFSKRFLPQRLCGKELPDWLSAEDVLKLNQIRGHSYAHCFFILEQFILQQASVAATGYAQVDRHAMSALLKFADEETKHQRMFIWVRETLGEQFAVRPELVDGVDELADRICSHSSFSVFLVALCLEWLTQKHYVECFQEEKGSLDPAFQKIFRLHWMEEAQHARIDALHLRRIATDLSLEGFQAGLREAEIILGHLRHAVERQDVLDFQSFVAQREEELTEFQEQALLAALKRESRWTFFESGLQHKAYQTLCEDLFPQELIEPAQSLAVA